MNDNEKAIFLNLANEYEEIEEKMSSLAEELQNFLKAFPVGTYVQDPITNLVYKVVKPNGKFVYYKEIDYVRTAKLGERSGSLSKKEAEAAGFNLKGE